MKTGWHALLCRIGVAGPLLLAGCGYQFPAERLAESQTASHWTHTLLNVENSPGGPRMEATLARVLEERLRTRLGPFASTRTSETTQRLTVHLDSVQRELLLEDRSGRANQYRITLTARPVVEQDGKPRSPAYPAIKGVATYYESNSGTATQAARNQAENEALGQLTEALISLLAYDSSPGK
ncbi:MAG: hypothetical protein G8237_13465 [Magnetococcales bacterium]|nr:hypothetical protein [Magnetococcales bacterium]